MKFGVRKLESWATRWWRNHDASFLSLDAIPASDGRADTLYRYYPRYSI